ncbi:MAG: hypothetical protein OK439_00940 [Thaumarchaeota archaeon]|nr:hypothetical protein [Nitrososphaerota archaeon]
MIRVVLEIISAILLIIFGILFLLYLPLSISELATDAIFIGAGALIMRKAFQDYKNEIIEEQSRKNDVRKTRRGNSKRDLNTKK